MTRVVAGFTAVGEDGREYPVLAYEELSPAGPVRLRGGGAVGSWAFRTGGRAVRRMGKGAYRLGGTGIVLRCNDRDAP
jgi:hypothetical protein